MTREELSKQAQKLKKQIHLATSEMDRVGRFKFKLTLMECGASETVARRLMSGEYDRNPRQDLVVTMEDALAKLRKAKAS